MNVYFSLGEAVAALGFIVVIIQFLKPIYLFRLQAYGIKTIYLFIVIFTGFSFALVSSLIPQPTLNSNFYEIPLFWEFSGATLIGISYLTVSYIALKPAKLHNYNYKPFVRAAATFLAEAKDTELMSFAKDISYNLETLIKYTHTFEEAETISSIIELERLKALGQEKTIHGRVDICPFYAFAEKKKLERAHWASVLLGIISDKKFCDCLVTEAPFLTASMLNQLSEDKIYSKYAKSFIQEIAHRALLNDDSIINREARYQSLGRIKLLSRSLFSDNFILQNYNPIQFLSLEIKSFPENAFLERIECATNMMLSQAINNQDWWMHSEYIISIKNLYESIFRQIYFNSKTQKEMPRILTTLTINFYLETTRAITELSKEDQKSLFIPKSEEDLFKGDLCHTIASILYDSFESMANDFTDYEDVSYWHHAIRLYQSIFPPHQNQPSGLNPVQQHLIIMLIDKLNNNMEGWYPSISKILISIIGPYEYKGPQITNRSANIILRDAVYTELKKLPKLYLDEPEKFHDFLPSNVSYVHKTKTLIHTYRMGTRIKTHLQKLEMSEVDLYDEKNWSLENN